MFTLLHRYGKIRTDIIALMTADALIQFYRLAFNLRIQLKYFFGADSYAESASFAPLLIDSDVKKLLCQKIHLPPYNVITDYMILIYPPRRTVKK